MREHRANMANLIWLLEQAETIREVAKACDTVREDCAVLWATAKDKRIRRLAARMYRRIPTEHMLPRNTLAAKLLVFRQISDLPVR